MSVTGETIKFLQEWGMWTQVLLYDGKKSYSSYALSDEKALAEEFEGLKKVYVYDGEIMKEGHGRNPNPILNITFNDPFKEFYYHGSFQVVYGNLPKGKQELVKKITGRTYDEKEKVYSKTEELVVPMREEFDAIFEKHNLELKFASIFELNAYERN
ncbi:MAG: hypothetical protein K6A30_06715 [Lachnospiraceae bacterium]|nr:hypothetical protein [Lachnospiraceae bacterium]